MEVADLPEDLRGLIHPEPEPPWVPTPAATLAPDAPARFHSFRFIESWVTHIEQELSAVRTIQYTKDDQWLVMLSVKTAYEPLHNPSLEERVLSDFFVTPDLVRKIFPGYWKLVR